MKASVFIKTALIDQMQQIADLGLWFHLAKLIPQGVEVLTRVQYLGDEGGMVFLPLRIEDLVNRFYTDHFPPRYAKMSIDKVGTGFFSLYPHYYLTHTDALFDRHLTLVKSDSALNKFYVHVPQWFEDFKTACEVVLKKIESGELQDIEVLKMLSEE